MLPGCLAILSCEPLLPITLSCPHPPPTVCLCEEDPQCLWRAKEVCLALRLLRCDL